MNFQDSMKEVAMIPWQFLDSSFELRHSSFVIRHSRLSVSHRAGEDDAVVVPADGVERLRPRTSTRRRFRVSVAGQLAERGERSAETGPISVQRGRLHPLVKSPSVEGFIRFFSPVPICSARQ